jgi:hypothetical protein
MKKDVVIELLVEFIFFGLLAVIASFYYTLPDSLIITVAMALAFAFPRVAYGRMQDATRAGKIIMVVLGMVLVACAVANIIGWTAAQGVGLDTPRLDSDDGRYYHWALNHYDGRCKAPEITYDGFPMMMLLLWKLLGVSVLWPMVVNLMLTLFTVVLAGRMAVRILAGRVTQSNAVVSTLTMLLVSVLMYFLSQGLKVQKEALIYFAFVLLGYVFAGINDRDAYTRRSIITDIAAFAVGSFIIAYCRNTFMYMVMIGVALFVVANVRRNWKLGAVFAVLSIVAFTLGNCLAYYSVANHIRIVEGGVSIESQFVTSYTQQTYIDIIGRYFYMPLWERLLFIPVTSAIQFVIPFPWLRTPEFTAEAIMPRLRYGWNVVGGIALFYYLFVSWRRGKGLGTWAWWPVLSYAAIAFVTAGSVSRYILPLQPLFAVTAVYVILKLKDGEWRKLFKAWSCCYCIVLALVLAACYMI